MAPDGYFPCGKGRYLVPKDEDAARSSSALRQARHRGKAIVDECTGPNPESIFYGKSIVFTGALGSMPRSEAQQIIIYIGGLPGDSVRKDTDFLVVGQQDYRIVGDSGMSSKQRKAVDMVNKGHSIEIISEEDFLKNL